MTDAQKHGTEPAFPGESDTYIPEMNEWKSAFGPLGASGLTKREYFAGQALIGLIALDSDAEFDGITYDAVRLADLLLENLAKAGGEA
jgi:hypothetical protein